ncbi:hypothetical protein KIN20_005656 [Parelaphostrongylus tenuis]|uniref:Uncharacterized protein n=1 Tax=Parelaphostrongylus tenuis TaxID=148309 RepID=A0AAD5M2H8_PARTN|nr:hypothetical protein KIN20_005656 [Parelaphostrongylus tenuis]
MHQAPTRSNPTSWPPEKTSQWSKSPPARYDEQDNEDTVEAGSYCRIYCDDLKLEGRTGGRLQTPTYAE